MESHRALISLTLARLCLRATRHVTARTKHRPHPEERGLLRMRSAGIVGKLDTFTPSLVRQAEQERGSCRKSLQLLGVMSRRLRKIPPRGARHQPKTRLR